MAPFIALFRAVNVGGTGLVSMAGLRDLASAIGLEDARTLLQSGNLLFRARGAKPGALEARLEAEAVARLGLKTVVFVRSAQEWQRVIERNPFGKEADADPGRLLVLALKHEPGPEAVRALRASIKGRELVECVGRQLYAVYPDGAGKSKLTTAVIERALATPVTARNWNTARKIAAALAAVAGGET